MRKPAGRIARSTHALMVASTLILAAPACAQTASAPGAAPAGDGTFLLTIFLKHDESKTLPQINQQLNEQGYFKAFPPPGIEVVSWYVMMGIGQVVTLRVPADRLREVNSRDRDHGVGRLSHGVLSDVRLQGRRAEAARGDGTSNAFARFFDANGRKKTRIAASFLLAGRASLREKRDPPRPG